VTLSCELLNLSRIISRGRSGIARSPVEKPSLAFRIDQVKESLSSESVYWVGPLLWPAVVLHAVLTLLLARVWFTDLHSQDSNEK
jgi:hypothetical protein